MTSIRIGLRPLVIPQNPTLPLAAAMPLLLDSFQAVAAGPLLASALAWQVTKLNDLDTKMTAAKIPADQRDEIKHQLSLRGVTSAFDAGLAEVGAALNAASPKEAVKDLITRWRIDQSYEKANTTYNVDGSDVQSRPFFRITDGFNGDPEKIKSRLRKATGRSDKAFTTAAHKAAYGRASPSEVKLLTDALIKAGKLADIKKDHPGLAGADQIKKLQWEYGVGVDCSGYTQMTFLDVHGGSRAKYGFDSLGNENLYDLKGNKAFKVVSPENARSGDLLILRPPKNDDAGHTVLIRDRRERTASEKSTWSDPQSFAGASDKVHVVEVDSSFGAGPSGDLAIGGVQRRTWLYNETTKKWAAVEGGTIVPSKDTGPYDHPMQAIYHPK